MSIIYRVRNEIVNPKTTTRPNMKSKTQGSFTGQQSYNVGKKALGVGNLVDNIQNDQQSSWVLAERTTQFVGVSLLPMLLSNALNKVDDIMLQSTKNVGSNALDNLKDSKRLAATQMRIKTAKFAIPLIVTLGISVSTYHRQQNLTNRKVNYQRSFNGSLINKR